MGLYIGNTEISNVYRGNTEISNIYRGQIAVEFAGNNDGVADFFGDGSNLLTVDASSGTILAKETGVTFRGYRNQSSLQQSVITYRTDLPPSRSGFGKSITLSDNTDGATMTVDGVNTDACKTYSFWVYVVVHDNDDNLVLNVNLKRQNASDMRISAYETDRSASTYDSFSTLSTGTWHHMVVTDTGTNMLTYIDNTLSGTHAIDNKIIIDPYNGGGNWSGTSNERRIKFISDADASNEVWVVGMRMFNRSVSSEEVTTLYNEYLS